MTREEREKAIAHGKEQLEVFGGEHAKFIKLAIETLEKEPCENVVERKKGKWIIDDKEYNKIWHCHCSKCKKDPQDYVGGSENWWLVQLPNYCPNCGLEMEDGE